MLDRPTETPLSVDPFEVLQKKGYRSVFARFGGEAMCPHCGTRIPREALPVTERVSHDGRELHGVSCPECGARGFLMETRG